ncbi:MAG TPA: EamA family transporter [Actinomycetes bacterium]|nr:EamA family transporter [Actinomycetes bacterium]
MTATVVALRSAVRSRAGTLWLAMATVYVVWGSTYLAIRVVIETMPPMLSAGVRFLVAAGIVGMILIGRSGLKVLRVERHQAAAAALVGILLLVGGNGGVVLGERTVASGIAALLVAMVPLWVVVLRALTGDRPRSRTVLGVLVGFAGLTILVVPSGNAGTTTVGGILLIIGASLSWSIGSLLAGRVAMPANPFVTTFYEMLAGGSVLVLIGLAATEAKDVDLGTISGRSWLALAYLVVMGSVVAFSAYVWLLHNAPISLVATYAYVNPVIAVLLGALILNEPITAAVVAGGAVIVLGVVLVVSKERQR